MQPEPSLQETTTPPRSVVQATPFSNTPPSHSQQALRQSPNLNQSHPDLQAQRSAQLYGRQAVNQAFGLDNAGSESDRLTTPLNQNAIMGDQIYDYHRSLTMKSPQRRMHWAYQCYLYLIIGLSALNIVPAMISAILVGRASLWLGFVLSIFIFMYTLFEYCAKSRPEYRKNPFELLVSTAYYTLSFLSMIFLAVDIGASLNEDCGNGNPYAYQQYYGHYGHPYGYNNYGNPYGYNNYGNSPIVNPLAEYSWLFVTYLSAYGSILAFNVGYIALEGPFVRKTIEKNA